MLKTISLTELLLKLNLHINLTYPYIAPNAIGALAHGVFYDTVHKW